MSSQLSTDTSAPGAQVFATRKQFAAIIGTTNTYVSKLIARKKIVLSVDGGAVDVDASLRLMKYTSDPSKAAVRERWEAHRAGRSIEIHPPLMKITRTDQTQRKDDEQESNANALFEERTASRNKRERAEAEMSELKLNEQLNKLARVDDIARAILDTHTSARTEVLGLPDRLTQLVVVETDARKVYDIIIRECERVCERMQRRVEQLREKHAAVTL